MVNFSTSDYLPTTLTEAKSQGIKELDVIIVSADAYVDHPSFGPAIIGRFLQSLGLKVGIIPQPLIQNIDDFKALGKPRLFFGVTAGNLDSMVALYTSQRKIRSDDRYSEKGSSFKRPYLPCIKYTNRLKEIYKGIPVILGGIEASLRKIAHYDFYTDKIRPSILLDAKADLLIYGNGEAPLRELVNRITSGKKISGIRGTVELIKGNQKLDLPFHEKIPSYEKVKSDVNAFNLMTRTLLSNQNPYNAVPLFQETGTRGILVNPPSFPLTPDELDNIYNLPFKRKPHPGYKKEIPAFTMIENSITVHRGCYGGCSFCSVYLHQGKIIQSRSMTSIRKEASEIANKTKKAVITDVGGPTANMYATYCINKESEKKCHRLSCIYPKICKNLNSSSKKYIKLLGILKKTDGIKAVFINSGIRCDIALQNTEFIKELAANYTQGQLSVAPEHCTPNILSIMKKPAIEIFERFASIFISNSKKTGKKQFIIPYFIIGHPGENEETIKALKRYMIKKNIYVEQIQEFYPTPMSISTAIYYTMVDPITGEKVKVEKKLGKKKYWKKIILSQKYQS